MDTRLSRDTSLERAAEAVRHAPELYCAPEVAECRTILVRLDEDWVNYATMLRIGAAWDGGGDGDDINAGNLRLLRRRLDPKDIKSAQDLVAALAWWKPHAGRENQTDFQDPAHAHRLYRGGWPTGKPSWRIELHERGSNLHSTSSPEGPFFEAAHAYFAETIADAAAAWFDNPSWPRNHHIEDYYYVLIEDLRGRFEGITLDDSRRLTAKVSAHPEISAYVCAKFLDGRRVAGNAVQAVEGGSATVRLPDEADVISLFLMTADGQCLDKYQEGERYRSWGDGVLHPVNPVLRELREAILYGEGEVTELKQWIPLTGDKAAELLRTVAAFANSKGGVVLVGVEDDGEMTGTLTHLKQRYGGEFRDDVGGMKVRYVADLKKLISEGVVPHIRPTFSWNELAGADVLRIEVPRGAEPPYSDMRSGYIYVRPTGRNRRAIPEELERMYGSRQESLEFSRP